MQTEQLLCCSGMTDTEHSTSGSNEEDVKGVLNPNFRPVSFELKKI